MIRKFLFLFVSFGIVLTQANASVCAVVCFNEMKMAKAPVKASMKMKADHSCCKEKNKKEDPSKNCMDDQQGCSHEVSSELTPHYELTSLDMVAISMPLFLTPTIQVVGVNNRYKPKPDSPQFLKYKSRLDLYILKDQFLI